MADETTSAKTSFDRDGGLETDVALLVAALGGGTGDARPASRSCPEPEDADGAWPHDEAA